jgi:hypothetical protein
MDDSHSGNFVSFACSTDTSYNDLATLWFNTQVGFLGLAQTLWGPRGQEGGFQSSHSFPASIKASPSLSPILFLPPGMQDDAIRNLFSSKTKQVSLLRALESSNDSSSSNH